MSDQDLTTKVAVLRAEFDAHREYTKKALELQADEYQRRLDTLNHAHGEAMQVQGTFLPREVADKLIAPLTERLANLERWRAQVEGRGGGTSATVVWIFAGLSAFATLVGLVVLFRGGG